MTRWIGVMTGTSLDGIDAVLLSVDGSRLVREDAESQPMPADLRRRLEDVLSPQASLDQVMALAAPYTDALLPAILALLARSPGPVQGIGVHGQTLRHRPELGYSLQLLLPARISEATGLDVYFDFRNADIAAGGQGAPLVPPFHAALLQAAVDRHANPLGADACLGVLNLGGIANLTLWSPSTQRLLGFDTGPANTLMDGWIRRHRGEPFDRDGRWAATGQVDEPLLAQMLQTPYFHQPAPKSTGRETFDLTWLDGQLQALGRPLSPENVQASLLALTALSAAQAARAALRSTTLGRLQSLYVCGGGARNPVLMQALAAAFEVPTQPTEAMGWSGQEIEAAAFAWLAHACWAREPANAPSVTGAHRLRVLGCISPGG